jgi:hypothetical protein
MEQQKKCILLISTVLCHGLLNMHETKYGMQSTEEILREGMKHGFERMCIFLSKTG